MNEIQVNNQKSNIFNNNILKFLSIIIWLIIIILTYKYELTEVCSSNWKYCTSYFGNKMSLDLTENEYLIYTSITSENISLINFIKLLFYDPKFFIKYTISIFWLPILGLVIYLFYTNKNKLYNKIINEK